MVFNLAIALANFCGIQGRFLSLRGNIAVEAFEPPVWLVKSVSMVDRVDLKLFPLFGSGFEIVHETILHETIL